MLRRQFHRFWYRLRRGLVEVLRTASSDHTVSIGYAIGTFISILPTPGFSVLVGVLVVMIFPRISKVAVFLAMAIWNAWTAMPIYWLSAVIGEAIFGDAPIVWFELEALNQVFQYTRRFLIGNLIFSIPFSFFSYFLARWVLQTVRIRRRARRFAIRRARRLRRVV